jgi:SAM-dependent methyltransferase
VSVAPAWRVAERALRRACGLRPRADTADRRLLEHCVLPHYAARADMRRVLIVGTRWYCSHYPSLLARQHCVTLDRDPGAARFGSAAQHLVGDVRDVGELVEPASLDLVLFNGVFGWGLDDPDDLAQAVDGLALALRPGGELVFGWNDTPRRRPFAWRRLAAWQAFEPHPFAPLGGVTQIELPTDNRHCFHFFARRTPS